MFRNPVILEQMIHDVLFIVSWYMYHFYAQFTCIESSYSLACNWYLQRTNWTAVVYMKSYIILDSCASRCK
jgi:hypothetical protein